MSVRRSGIEQIVAALASKDLENIESNDKLAAIIEEAELGHISLKEMVEMLQELPEWKQIAAILSNIEED